MLIDNSAGSDAVAVTLNLGGFAVVGAEGADAVALTSLTLESFSQDAVASAVFPFNLLSVDRLFDIDVGLGDAVAVSGVFTFAGTAPGSPDSFLAEGSFGLNVTEITPAGTEVSEQGAMALFGIGLVGFGALRRRRRLTA